MRLISTSVAPAIHLGKLALERGERPATGGRGGCAAPSPNIVHYLNYLDSRWTGTKTCFTCHTATLLGRPDRLGAGSGTARYPRSAPLRSLAGRLRGPRRAGAGDEDHQPRHPRSSTSTRARRRCSAMKRAQHPRPIGRPLRPFGLGAARHRLHAAGPRHSGREAAGASQGTVAIVRGLLTQGRSSPTTGSGFKPTISIARRTHR